MVHPSREMILEASLRPKWSLMDDVMPIDFDIGCLFSSQTYGIFSTSREDRLSMVAYQNRLYELMGRLILSGWYTVTGENRDSDSQSGYICVIECDTPPHIRHKNQLPEGGCIYHLPFDLIAIMAVEKLLLLDEEPAGDIARCLAQLFLLGIKMAEHQGIDKVYVERSLIETA